MNQQINTCHICKEIYVGKHKTHTYPIECKCGGIILNRFGLDTLNKRANGYFPVKVHENHMINKAEYGILKKKRARAVTKALLKMRD